MSLAPLETRLHYSFKKPELLRQAVTHRSHSATHNERLEFLGDSVLNCVVATLLFRRFAMLNEGDLSRVRANLVRQQTLYELAQKVNLADYLRLGEGELKSGGMKRPSILADTLEAIFGAIYLDGGFQAAEAAISGLYESILANIDPLTLGKDAKTLLQEHLQANQIALPQYVVVATHGAAHNQEFEVECAIPKLDIRVRGAGSSRRAAEQVAAVNALERMTAVAPAITSGRARAKRGKAPRGSKPAVAVKVVTAASVATTASAENAAKAPEPLAGKKGSGGPGGLPGRMKTSLTGSGTVPPVKRHRLSLSPAARATEAEADSKPQRNDESSAG